MLIGRDNEKNVHLQNIYDTDELKKEATTEKNKKRESHETKGVRGSRVIGA